MNLNFTIADCTNYHNMVMYMKMNIGENDYLNIQEVVKTIG